MRLSWQLDDAVRAADREALSLLGQRRQRRRHERCELLRQRGEDAELVTAESIGPPAVCDSRGKPCAQPGGRGVSGHMTERVVVGLEPVEVVEHKPDGCLLVEPLEIGHQPTAIPEAYKHIRIRLGAL